MRPKSLQFTRLLCCLVLMGTFTLECLAQVPDLTAGGQPTNTVTTNLGATGLRGWVYHTGKADTSQSRQILLTAVDAGSPADGALAVDDVILGADGSGATATAFTSDARRSFAVAIGDAEARDPGTLSLLRWRNGTTSTVKITLRTMGAYTSTAPYNCPKSALILQEGFDKVASGGFGKWNFGALGLLASGDPSHLPKIRNAVYSDIPNQSELAELLSDEPDTASNVTWPRGHQLILFAEYYLATGDQTVLPAIEAYAFNIARNQSLLGTVGHKYADRLPDGSNGPMGGVYGVVNSAGLPCFLGMLLARECGVANPVVDAAIESSSRFFSYYAGKGAIPYGEHEPSASNHESNGKSGLAALALSLQDERIDEARFFTKMAVAAAGEREIGHTGSFFNYLWSPLGANVGGEAAAAAHFRDISWHLDLSRNWTGSFDYDCLNGEGPDSGSSYHSFQMNTAALLVYALPLRQLLITGRDQDGSYWLTGNEVAAAEEAGEYNASNYTLTELIDDLGHWSPKVWNAAAGGIKNNHSLTTQRRAEINALATDPNSDSRFGACLLLSKIRDVEAAATLASLLDDPENHVRFLAAKGMRSMGSNRDAHLDTMLEAVVSTAKPFLPFDEEDPMHMAHGQLCMLLFHHKNTFGAKGVLFSGFSGVDRTLLLPAIRAAAANPVGACNRGVSRAFNFLSQAEALELSDTIIDAALHRAPVDKMFTQDIRVGALEALRKYKIGEGVPLCIIVSENDTRGSVRRDCMDILGSYGSAALTVTPDPDPLGWLAQRYAQNGESEAQEAIDAINNDSNPITLRELKTLNSVGVDDSTVTLPSNATLRADASDIGNGDLIYTWCQISGPGNSSVTPNGTAQSFESIMDALDVPGSYEMELTVSDSRGLTEVGDAITVEFVVPENDVTPPSPNPMAFEVAPFSISEHTVSMTAMGATDSSGPVEYYFTNVTVGDGSHDSGWQDSASYTDTGLNSGTSYTYTVMARDKSPAQNVTAPSSAETATTTSGGGGPIGPIAGVDFDNAAGSSFDRTPDDLDPGDGISVSNGWTLAGAASSVKELGGTANNGATSGAFVGKLDGGSSQAGMPANTPADYYSWAITIPAGVTLNLSEITFDLRQGTTTASNSRWAMFNTSLDGGPGSAALWSKADPVLRYNWENVSVDLSGAAYQGLTDTTVTFYWYNERTGSDIDSIVVTGSTGSGSADYSNWAAIYPGADLSDPTADFDGDGLSNDEERIWGLDPADSGSINPYASLIDVTGSFSYTRRDPVLNGKTYTIWTSTNLADWTDDTGATQSPGTANANGVQTVAVTLAAAPVDGRLFVRIQAH